MASNGLEGDSDKEYKHGGKRQCERKYDENQKYREDLAAAFQLMSHFNLNEGSIYNHLSLMAPARSGHGEVMLINAFGTVWSQVTASNLIGVDLDTGKTVEGEGRVFPIALSLHRAMRKTRPEIQCAMHTHQPYVSALNCLTDPRLLMIHQTSCTFYDRIVYDDVYNGVIDTDEEGERIAQVMGDKDILFQCNHGVTAVGPTVAFTFWRLFGLEQACMYQMMAMNTGRSLKEIPLDIVLKTKEQSDKADFDFDFDSMKKMLLNKGSNFKS